ncbi:MAG: CpXC domain-containing protein [Anaerolineae bacterium]
MIRPQTVSVTCPSCRQNYATHVYPVVDVTEAPELKDLLLRGTLNAGICPHCGTQVEIVSPFLYVDREKELALVLMPQELGMDNARQQALIGDLTNRVLNALPPEQRKAYLLQPRMFFTRKSLVETVLGADGVTPEMLRALQAKGAFLGELLSVADDDKKLEALLRERNAEVDEDLFAMATDVLQQSAQAGEMAQAARAARVREAIIEHSTWGQKVLSEALEQRAAQKAEAQAQFLEAILAAKDEEELELLLWDNRPLVDADLYQLFAKRAEEAQGAGNEKEAKRLRDLRRNVQRLTKRLDRELEEQLNKALALLETLAGAKDMAAAVQEHAAEVTPLLLKVIEFNAELALEKGYRDIANRLTVLWKLVSDVLRDKAPWPVRLLNLLLDAEDAEERRQIMQEHRDEMNTDFLAFLDEVLNDVELEGDWSEVEALRQVRQETAEFIRG